jgi:lipoic acid synthetase
MSSRSPASVINLKRRRIKRRPDWIRVRTVRRDITETLRKFMRSKGLNSVCEEARCPNIGDCWDRGKATFLILGDICTRHCRFCDVQTDRPFPIDWEEPQRVAHLVRSMALNHGMITSVNRDEGFHGGAPVLRCVFSISEKYGRVARSKFLSSFSKVV